MQLAHADGTHPVHPGCQQAAVAGDGMTEGAAPPAEPSQMTVTSTEEGGTAELRQRPEPDGSGAPLSDGSAELRGSSPTPKGQPSGEQQGDPPAE